jgi:hypothetical protein
LGTAQLKSTIFGVIGMIPVVGNLLSSIIEIAWEEGLGEILSEKN